MQKQIATSALAPLPIEQIARIKALVEAKGVVRSADLLGLAQNTFDRARGGLPLHPGTRALVTAALAKRDQENKNP
jgi:hypothetical protein